MTRLHRWELLLYPLFTDPVLFEIITKLLDYSVDNGIADVPRNQLKTLEDAIYLVSLSPEPSV